MQRFTLFDNPLFRQIWYDIPGVFAITDLQADLLVVWTNYTIKEISLSLDGWKGQNVHKIFAYYWSLDYS